MSDKELYNKVKEKFGLDDQIRFGEVDDVQDILDMNVDMIRSLCTCLQRLLDLGDTELVLEILNESSSIDSNMDKT